MQNSNKLQLDKYYTTRDLAKYCIDKTFEVLKNEEITEIIEPSAGNGSFSSQIRGCIAYDIKPDSEDIIEQNFLELNIKYKKGRLIIGNPPYGSRNTLAVQFYKKAIDLGDYISFILPISQFNNNQQMYEFDLIHTEDLGVKLYSDRKVHCCLNIYRRPQSGILNEKPSFKLRDVEVVEYRRGGSYKKPVYYDFGMCSWGASLGKEIEYIGQYAQENYIIIKNKTFRNEIINLCKNTDWKSLYPYTSTPKIQTWKIYKYIKEQIPEIE